MLTPEHRAAWMASVNEWRHLEDDDLADDRAFVLAVADHLVALEAQVAEARRLIEAYGKYWDNRAQTSTCAGCDRDWYESVVHLPDCPIGAFLAATAPQDGAGETTT